MAIEFIDLKAQYARIKPSVDRRMATVLRHSQFIMGPEIAELETELARFCQVKHCITCASGTDALLIALMALDIKPGDEVITTPFTFIATVEMIALLGARPVFVDIDERTYNLDPRELESKITPRTRAILPVSLYGQCADMDAINAIAAKHSLLVIEDSAQSFGATYKGRPSGSLSAIACTSFFPSKPLGCYGDGGACFTDDDHLATVMRQIRVHGQDRRYHHPIIGINGRLDTLQAAVLLAKMEVFADELQARQRIAAQYSELLGGHVTVPHVEPLNTSAWAQYTIAVEARKAVQQAVAQNGIPTAVHYPVPLHLQPAFAHLGVPSGAMPKSERAASRVLSLPMHPYLDTESINSIVAAVREAVAVQPAMAAR